MWVAQSPLATNRVVVSGLTIALSVHKIGQKSLVAFDSPFPSDFSRVSVGVIYLEHELRQNIRGESPLSMGTSAMRSAVRG